MGRTSAPPGTYRARVVLTSRAVEDLAPAWDDLRESLGASPFVGPTLYTAWLAERGQGVRPLVVAVEDAGGSLRAVAPLVRRGRLAYSLPGRVKVAGELLADPADATDAWRAVLASVLGPVGVRLLLVPHATDDRLGAPGLI